MGIRGERAEEKKARQERSLRTNEIVTLSVFGPLGSVQLFCGVVVQKALLKLIMRTGNLAFCAYFSSLSLISWAASPTLCQSALFLQLFNPFSCHHC